MTFRVLVTGPRDWPDRYLVHYELDNLAQAHDLKCGTGYSVNKERMIVVHGKAYRGVDYFADLWAEVYGIPESYEAQWRPFGVLDKLAGFSRNQLMVDTHPDACLAFLMKCTKKNCRKTTFHYTHGTWDCVTRARKAGIPVIECYLPAGAGLSGGRHGSGNAPRAVKISVHDASPGCAPAPPSTAG